ncbi:MAG: hypothetical protein ACKOAP_02160 [Vulcanococcus sp.]
MTSALLSMSVAPIKTFCARAVSGASDQALAGINSWGDALMHCFGAETAETEH